MVAYAPEKGLAAYAPLQICHQPAEHTLDIDSFVDYLTRGKRLERKAAFTELLALDHSLVRGFGCSLASTAPWTESCLRPLSPGEQRVKRADGFVTIVLPDGTERPEIPPGNELWPGVVHWVDQGSVGASALNFCINALGYHMVMFPDPNHRVWNDIKAAAQKSKEYFWKTIVQLTLVFNLNYGPFGKSRWFHDKKAFFEAWAAQATVHDPHFQRYAAHIAEDIGASPPATEAEHQQLLDSVLGMKSFVTKGPLVKMMRWFSWFESAAFYRRELHSIRMILEAFVEAHGTADAEETGPAEGAASAEAPTGPDTKAIAMDELRQLKAKQGCWRTAIQCINAANVWRMKCLQAAIAPIWCAQTARVTSVRTPAGGSYSTR